MKQKTIDAERTKPVAAGKMLIDDGWVEAASGATLPTISPIDGKELTTIAAAGSEDVNRAVAAAKLSFERGVWSKRAPGERKKVLLRIADLIEQNALELAVLGVRDNGTEIAMAMKAEPGSAAGTFRYYAECIDKVYGEIAPTGDTVLGLVHREPIGVVGVIVPWNFPLMIAAWKIAAALALGNSVVVKPSEIASLSVLGLGALCMEAGLPEGVLNIVTGPGADAGEAIGLHNDIGVLAFTGSGATGRRLLNYAAQSNLKRVYLELGGKSPNILFADAPELDHAISTSAGGIFRNSGQVCVAGSRLLVERSILDEVIEKISQKAAAYKVGDPLLLDTEIGAVSSEMQLWSNLKFVDEALQEGATIKSGGNVLHEETGGFYMEPTVITEVTQDMKVVCNEVFGPVVAVMGFEDEEEAVRLANDTEYGLAAAVWTTNLSRAHHLTRAINAGVVHVNTYGGTDITVPMGGFKQSGNGTDKSLHALDKFSNLKTVWMQL